MAVALERAQAQPSEPEHASQHQRAHGQQGGQPEQDHDRDHGQVSLKIVALSLLPGCLAEVGTSCFSADPLEYQLQGSSIDLDSEQVPHLAFYDATDHAVVYGKRLDGSWLLDKIADSESDTISLFIVDEKPIVVLQEYVPRRTRYFYNSSGWKFREIPIPDDVRDIAVFFTEGNRMLLVTVSSVGDLRFIEYVDDISTIDEFVENGALFLSKNSIAVDSGGRVHICYFDSVSLKYAVRNVGEWVVEVVLNEDAGGNCSIGVSDNGSIYISHGDTFLQILNCSYKTLDVWNTKMLDNSGSVGSVSDLDMSQDGFPHVAYFDFSNEDLKYTVLSSSGWQIDTIDSQERVGRFPSLRVDEAGNAHVVYIDSTNNRIKYACGSGSQWSIETVPELEK